MDLATMTRYQAHLRAAEREQYAQIGRVFSGEGGAGVEVFITAGVGIHCADEKAAKALREQLDAAIRGVLEPVLEGYRQKIRAAVG